MHSQRSSLLERQIAGIIAWTGQRSPRLDDRSVEVGAVGGDAVADLTTAGPLPGQGAGEMSPIDEANHDAAGVLAEDRAALGGVDTFEADDRTGNNNGVAINHVGGTADDRLRGCCR